jgi:hypothetical protein
MLFGTGKIKGGGAVKREVEAHRPALLLALDRIKLDRNADCNDDLLPDNVKAVGT